LQRRVIPSLVTNAFFWVLFGWKIITLHILLVTTPEFFQYEDELHHHYVDNDTIETAFGETFYTTKLNVIKDRIQELASREHGLSTVTSSVVIGFTPLEAGQWTKRGLETNNPWMVNERRSISKGVIM